MEWKINGKRNRLLLLDYFPAFIHKRSHIKQNQDISAYCIAFPTLKEKREEGLLLNTIYAIKYLNCINLILLAARKILVNVVPSLNAGTSFISQEEKTNITFRPKKSNFSCQLLIVFNKHFLNEGESPHPLIVKVLNNYLLQKTYLYAVWVRNAVEFRYRKFNAVS